MKAVLKLHGGPHIVSVIWGEYVIVVYSRLVRDLYHLLTTITCSP